MAKIFYEKDGEEFVLIFELDQGTRDIHGRDLEIAVAYTYSKENKNFITFKHGSPELVDAWAQTYNRRIREVLKAVPESSPAQREIIQGMQMQVISTNQWDIDDLNWVIQNINGLNRVAAKYGLELREGETCANSSAL